MGFNSGFKGLKGCRGDRLRRHMVARLRIHGAVPHYPSSLYGVDKFVSGIYAFLGFYAA